MHMDVHALLTVAIFSGVKSSLLQYGSIFLMTFSEMFSLSNSFKLSRNFCGFPIIPLPTSQ